MKSNKYTEPNRARVSRVLGRLLDTHPDIEVFNQDHDAVDFVFGGKPFYLILFDPIEVEAEIEAEKAGKEEVHELAKH